MPSCLVGSGEKIFVGSQCARVLVEPDVDDLVGDGFVDDVLKPFSATSGLGIQGSEPGEVGLDVAFVL
jgi:hypothetical protein